MKTPDQHGGGLQKDATPSITPERLQQQAEAIEKSVHNSLRAYLDDRLKSPPQRSGGWWARHRSDLYFLATVVALVFLYRVAREGNSSQGGEQNPTTFTTEFQVDNSLMSKLVTEPESGFKFFRSKYSTRTNSWLATVVAAQTDTAQKRELTAITAKSVDQLTSDDCSLLLGAIFVYAYQRWSDKDVRPQPDSFRITMGAGVDPSDLNTLVQWLDLQDVLRGKTLDAKDETVRAAVALRWMQSYASTDTLDIH